MKEELILEVFDNNSPLLQPKKVAEMDITEISLKEIAVILEIQEMIQRRWQIKRR